MNTQERNHPPVLDPIDAPASQYVRETSNLFGETAARAGEELKENLNDIKTKFNGVRHSVVDKTKEYSRMTNGYVNKNPWAAVGISAGFAFLVGMIIGRRHDNSKP